MQGTYNEKWTDEIGANRELKTKRKNKLIRNYHIKQLNSGRVIHVID